uniref:C-type lectin domain-containing protein n=1 Tax=Mola mola TaxID=94237 RepID=A0A3Q3VI36_MOLML
MYSQLIDEDEEDGGGKDVHPVSPAQVVPRPSGPGLYRPAAVCLAALSAILLISIIAVTAHYKKQPHGGGEAISQDTNVSTLIASISKLQQEKKQLLSEKAELLAKLAATKATTAVAPVPIVCPVDWHLFKNSCYFISKFLKDWSESQSYCQSQGGHLAIISTAEEQTFLWNFLPRGHWNTFWIGITDEQTEDQWKWVDGTPVVGGFWEVGEPNNHINEDCGFIVKTRVLKRVAIRSWYDAPCFMSCRFICEKEMGAGATTPHLDANASLIV